VVSYELLERRIKLKLPDRLPRAIDPEDLKQLLSVIELSDLQAWLGKHLAAYKVPDYWFEVKQLPKTAPGKIDRKSLHIRAKTAI